MKPLELDRFMSLDQSSEPNSPQGAEAAALASHLRTLRERLDALRDSAPPLARAELKVQIGRTLVGLGRGNEAWPMARTAFDAFFEAHEWESAVDACDVCFQTDQPGSLSALGQGLWLAVTCPIDPELSVTMLNHIIEETPGDSDGAAVAATTALFLVDLRASGAERENLHFFATQALGKVARDHSGVTEQEHFEAWLEKLELTDPTKFLPRLRAIVDLLVQDDWWFDREALQSKLPVT